MKHVFMLLLLLVTMGYADGLVLPYNKASIEVYDGDTFYVDLDISDCPDVLCKRVPIRISGIDTPELKHSNAVVKKYAILARNLLEDFLTVNEVFLHNCKRDMYYRLDCEVMSVSGVDYNTYIIGKQLAVPYYGKTKTYDWSKHTIK